MPFLLELNAEHEDHRRSVLKLREMLLVRPSSNIEPAPQNAALVRGQRYARELLWVAG